MGTIVATSSAFGTLTVGSLSAPVMTARPTIDNGSPSGSGVTLTATPGTYTNSPTSYVREWRRNNVSIGSGLTLGLTSPDEAQFVSFYEKAVNASGDSGFIRAETGNARQIFMLGDSLWPPELATAVQSALDSQFGAGAFEFINLSVSGQNYNHSTQNFGLMAGQSVDINIDTGWGLVMSFDYANQFTGLQGVDDGATGLAAIYAFSASRIAAGAFGHIYCTSPYPNGSYGSGHNGSAAFIASEDIATNYASNNGVALVDFRDSSLASNIIANDDIHWTSGAYATVAAAVVAGIVAAGLTPKCGGIRVPSSTGTNLVSYDGSYYYDPVQRLPWPCVASTITVTSANGWAAKTVAAAQAIEWLNLGASIGWQTLYYSASWQTSPLTGGHYTLNP